MASGHPVTPSVRHPVIRAALHILQITVVLLFAGYILSFADHARQLFGFPFPLDYGEGPLVMQVDQLRSGTPLRQLYTDPSAPPFLIINYPPVYLLLTAALSTLLGSTLFAGRLIALLSTLSVVVALAVLARQPARGQGDKGVRGQGAILRSSRPSSSTLHPPGSSLPVPLSLRSALLPALLFLTIPIVREWAVLMRVDLLGIALGLWGLVIVRRGGVRAITLGGLLIVASLCTKPSLLAAPLAAGGWLLWRVFRAGTAERRAALRDLIIFAVVVGASGMLVVGGLQWASGGWFWLHVVAANANRWEADLAWGFWLTQLQLRWPLVVLAGVAVWAVVQGQGDRGTRGPGDGRTDDVEQWMDDQPYHPLPTSPLAPLSPCPDRLLLPLLYTLGGVITAIGVGKVGAYSNYFLELYAGLIWLIALGAQAWPFSIRRPQRAQWPIWLLLTAALAYYPPLWDPDRLRPAGLIEPSPPRLAFGSYGLWADARRETAVLSALTRVNAALAADVRAAGPQIFTDLPGVAAAAGVGSRLQAFEARQLLDQGLADETALRSELANGELPLAVIDFLGNWLTPEVIELLQRRYAHDGSWGTFDMFRPIDVGPALPIRPSLSLAGGALTLNAYSLVAPLGTAYEPGELLTLALHFARTAAVDPAAPTPLVEVQLRDAAGLILAGTERPLLYGAIHPATWPLEGALEHFQPLGLPANLPDGRYTLAVVVRADAQDLGIVVNLAVLEVGALGGQLFTETGHFVPAPLLKRWTDLGGRERIGLPLTPLTPFAWGRLQCFEYACLEWHDQQVQLRNLGERLYLAETQRAPRCAEGLCAGFTAAAESYPELGTPISGAVRRNGWIVQWTTTTRLERAPEGGPIGIGRLGDDSLRLAPGMDYRWP